MTIWIWRRNIRLPLDRISTVSFTIAPSLLFFILRLHFSCYLALLGWVSFACFWCHLDPCKLPGWRPLVYPLQQFQTTYKECGSGREGTYLPVLRAQVPHASPAFTLWSFDRSIALACVCVPLSCLVPIKARRGHQIPRSWGYKQL